MNKRQQKILKAIIREYNETVQPVGSRILYEKYSLNISPATIRWEMVELTDDDYLEQPHISAGRIPTDRAYRLFTEELMEIRGLAKKEEERIQSYFAKIKEERNNKGDFINKQVVEILAEISHNLGLNRQEEVLYEAGLNWLVREPEFFEREKFVDLIDSFRGLDSVFDDIGGDLRIFVGEEFLGPKLKDCSLVVKKIKMPQEKESGAIGILGTKRMNYGKNISLLDYTSKMLTNLFN